MNTPPPINQNTTKIKIGITGQSGFIGTHLNNTLKLEKDKFEAIGFEDSYFQDEKKFKDFVAQCDVIIHLAAMNRHEDPETLYHTNMELVKKLITGCESTASTPHILFSSSIQETLDNRYGDSKKDGRILLEKWAMKNNAKFTSLIIPNVFGPFGAPHYNSVVATFCHQLSHNETTKINVDGNLALIYVSELVSEILNVIELSHNVSANEEIIRRIKIQHTAEIRVSQILELLDGFKAAYFDMGEIPNLDVPFNRNLFNTFLCYLDHEKFFPYHARLHTDDRGGFAELVKLKSGGQVSYSTTKPGITRGNHFHTRKAERFSVIKGKARIELRRIGSEIKLSFELDGEKPSFVDMPIWYTHNITNIGEEDLYTIFWINEHYDASDSDTYYEKV
jgi:UDP-2-acetamido-2,6-beta-L-arabino-hexul-4-ose reductase